MMGAADQIFPATPMISVLRFRPMAMALFEKYHIDPWQYPEAAVAEVCRRHGITWNLFEADMEMLSVPERHTEWSRKPVYHLLDYLCSEHRELERGYLPAIHYAEDMENRSGSHVALLYALARQWPEEEFLFPKILRHADALRTGHVDPDFNGGSVGKFVTVHLLKNEHHLNTHLGQLWNTIRFETDRLHPEAAQGHLLPLLSEFHNRLADHSRLEAEILYPRALETEKKLYDRYIAGSEAKTGNRISGLKAMV